jgi:hypothetical protein
MGLWSTNNEDAKCGADSLVRAGPLTRSPASSISSPADEGVARGAGVRPTYVFKGVITGLWLTKAMKTLNGLTVGGESACPTGFDQVEQALSPANGFSFGVFITFGGRQAHGHSLAIAVRSHRIRAALGNNQRDIVVLFVRAELPDFLNNGSE